MVIAYTGMSCKVMACVVVVYIIVAPGADGPLGHAEQVVVPMGSP